MADVAPARNEIRLGEGDDEGPTAVEPLIDPQPVALTEIYGEEDWSATIRKVDDEATEPSAEEEAATPLPDRERLAGMT